MVEQPALRCEDISAAAALLRTQALKTHLLRLGVHVPVSCVARTCAATWSLFEQTTIHRT